MAVAYPRVILFVADTYMPLPTCSPASPCSGSVAVFPILTAEQAGALKPAQPANTLGIGCRKSGNQRELLAAVPYRRGRCRRFCSDGNQRGEFRNSYLYVAGYDANTSLGYIFGFAPGSDGTLATISGFPVQVGAHPSAITSDSSGAYLYMTDSVQNVAYGFQIASGALTPLSGSPYATGSQPSAIVVDTTSKFAVVANTQDSNVTVYS